MKKLIVILIFATWTLCLSSCSYDSIDRTKPVFETNNISCITFFTPSNYEQGTEVPNENMDEIITWLGSFRLEAKAGESLRPGANAVSFRIEYSDGTIVENGVSTTMVDGVVYYMRSEDPPQCYSEIVLGEWVSD